VTVTIPDSHAVATDPAMPFMARALDPAHMQPRLRSLRGVGSDVELRAIRVTRWKPGRRCLVEYDLSGGSINAACRTLVGKVRAKSFDASTYTLARQLCEGGFQPNSADGVSVPAVLGAIPECHMWLQDKVSGTPGWEALRGADGLHAARRIGGALAKLQRVLPLPSRGHTMADELAGLDKGLDAVRGRYPQWDRRLSVVQRACQRLAAAARHPSVSAVHRDFYHDQVIVEGDRIWLLDLDLVAEGDPAVDAGNFVAHLAEQSLRVCRNPEALAAEEAAFVSAFYQAGGQADADNIEIYETLSLARHIYLSTTFETRRPYTSALLALCEQRLRL